MERYTAMTEIQEAVQTFLLTLASRIQDTKGVIIFVMEKDDTVMQHISHFSQEISWMKVVGNLESVKMQVLAEKVGFSKLNMDGSVADDGEEGSE